MALHVTCYMFRTHISIMYRYICTFYRYNSDNLELHFSSILFCENNSHLLISTINGGRK